MWRQAWWLFRAAVQKSADDDIPSMGAALAYYTVFSLAPLLLMMVTVAGFVFGNSAAAKAMLEQFSELIGTNGADAIRAILNGAHHSDGGAIPFLISSITLFIGATTVFAELQRDIDIIWRVEKQRQPASSIWQLLRVRVLSFGLILAVGFLLVVSLVISAGIAALSTLWGSGISDLEFSLQIINFFISTAVITVLFALIYKLLPSAPIAWRNVWLGALFTALLFDIGKFAIGLYIGKSAIASSFGAAGAFVVLVVWIYYSAQIFLFGTEFTYVYTRMHLHSSNATAANAVEKNRS